MEQAWSNIKIGTVVTVISVLLLVTTNNVTPCHSFPLLHGITTAKPVTLLPITKCIKDTVSLGGTVGSHRQSRPLFGIKPGNKFDMSDILRFEKELEWNDAESRVLDAPSSTPLPSSSSSYHGGDDLDTTDDDDAITPNSETSYRVPESLDNERLDAILSTLDTNLSRSQCGTLIANRRVDITRPQRKAQRITITRKSEKLFTNTTIHLRHVMEEDPTDIVPEKLPLDILYEDEHMIVLNKAAGMVVHPGAGNSNGTVVNALAHYLAYDSTYGSGEFIDDDGKVVTEPTTATKINGGTDGGETPTTQLRPGIVHRLDKGTTGVLIVAKTRAALATLAESFARRTVKKTYLAITVGNPGERVVIDKPIGRHPLHRQKMRVVPDPTKKNSSRATPNKKQRLTMIKTKRMTAAQAGRNALSFVDTLATDGKLSVVEVRIKTGRTHQIRVHLQDRTTPVYGDDVYGLPDWNKRLKKSHGVERPLLHAMRLEMNHPVSGERMVFRAGMAKDMEGIARGVWPEGDTERKDLFMGDKGGVVFVKDAEE